MKSKKQKEETVIAPHCDPQKYRHLIDDPSVPDEEKDRVILALWEITSNLFRKIMSGEIPTTPTEASPIPDTKQKDYLKEDQNNSSKRVRKKRKSSRKNIE